MTRPRFQIPDHDPGRPKVPDAVAAYAAIPVTESTSYLVHVVMEDGNLGCGFIAGMLASATDQREPEVVAFSRMLLAMTPTQRRKVYRRAPGMWRRGGA